MPGLLTPERRQRAKNRTRAGTGSNKKNLDEKIKKSKPKPRIESVDTNSYDNISYNSGSYNSILAPRTVSPTASQESSSPRKGYSRHDESTADITHSDMSSMGSPSSFSRRHGSNKYPIREEALYASDEDMPDDEMMGMRKSSPKKKKSSSSTSTTTTTKKLVTPTKTEVGNVLGLSNIMAMVTPSNWTGNEDAKQESPVHKSAETTAKPASPNSTVSGIQKIIEALQADPPPIRPSNLSPQESLLWETLETALANERNDQRLATEEKFAAMSIVVEKQKNNKGSEQTEEKGKTGILGVHLQQIESLQQELQAKDAQMKKLEESHQSEVLAIQRVLADVTTEKMKLEGVDVSDIKPDDSQKLAKAKEELAAAKEQAEAAKREADTKLVQIKALENGLEKARAENKKLAEESEETLEEIQSLKSIMATMKSMAETGNSAAAMEKLEDEVNHQKLETEKLKVEKMETQVALASAQEEVRKLKAENEFATQEMKKFQEERDEAMAAAEASSEKAKLAQESVEKLTKEKEEASNQLEELRKSKEHAMSEVDKAINQAKAIKAEHPPISPSNSAELDSGENNKAKAKPKPEVTIEEYAKLQQSLTETTASLETSKKIIASLESANGSLAVDSRSKLKEKEEELAVVQKESDDRKRNLDSLATELRDLQRKQGDIENADRRTKVQLIRQKALMDHLESTLNDLQEAVIVHETSVNMAESTGVTGNSNLEEISEILGDALHAITATLETSEEFVDDVDGSSDGEYGEMNSQMDVILHNNRDQTTQGLKNELDQKKVAVKRLEEALKKQNDEVKRMRSQFYNSDNGQLRSEIQRLRQQCSTNMEVLAKKERELSVLKASLKVDENESGYISDDASDEEDEDIGADTGSIMSAAKMGAYGPADAEAYATILSQANGRIGMPAAAQIQEIESLKRDLMEALGEKESASKELEARRQSLVNAKMIISSLEQANKGMMADLRSRLQDSNTAISSLLNKSKQHETAADELRQKLQALEEERQEERKQYEAKLSKWRNEVSLDEKKEDSS